MRTSICRASIVAVGSQRPGKRKENAHGIRFEKTVSESNRDRGCGRISRPLRAEPLGIPIGCQVYPVREALGKDFEGTLAQLAQIGYKMIEMCSPPGYERSGFGPLVSKTASDVRKAIHAAGLGCESCHFTSRELKESLDERIAYAKELGLKQMVLSTFGLKPDAGMAEWVGAAEELNRIAEK